MGQGLNKLFNKFKNKRSIVVLNTRNFPTMQSLDNQLSEQTPKGIAYEERGFEVKLSIAIVKNKVSLFQNFICS
jgi:hypothetical protein